MKSKIQTHCPSCREPVAKFDRRRKQPLQPCNGAILTTGHNEAPRLKCPCGVVVILLEGSL